MITVKSRFPKKVEDAIRRLEDTVYEEIARLVETRGSAETIAGLTTFLGDVQRLRATSSQSGEGRIAASAGEPVAGVRQSGDFAEFSIQDEVLVRRGPREGGAGYYEQRVPWEAVKRLSEVVDQEYGNRSFHPATLGRQLDLPAYQVYAVLRLLVGHRVVESPRRGAYRRIRGTSLPGSISALRMSLPGVRPVDSSEASERKTEEKDEEAVKARS